MNNEARVAVAAVDEKIELAKNIAQQYNLPYLSSHTAVDAYDFVLYINANQFELHQSNHKKSKPFILDLISPQLLYRYKKTSAKKELIARAIHLKPQSQPFIIDATAGFGRDSMILASLGYEVTLLEQSPIVYLLLRESLERAEKNNALKSVVERLHLIHVNACEWLKQSEKSPDIVYLDPMFPMRQKSAAVKKESTTLQNLLQNHTFDDASLLRLALSCAKHRVVVKRPRLAPSLEGRAPDFSLQGRTIRFDVYLPKK